MRDQEVGKLYTRCLLFIEHCKIHFALFSTLRELVVSFGSFMMCARYCLASRVKSGNSCWCSFHHMRGSVVGRLLHFHVGLNLGFPWREDGSESRDVVLMPKISLPERTGRSPWMWY